MSLEQELAGALAAASAGHDVLPFMQAMLDVKAMAFRPLPANMLAILQSSLDYAPVPAGAGPVHMQIESDRGHATLILYRSSHSGLLYVLGPAPG